MIAIIDYGAGNVHNVQSILEYLGEKTLITSNPLDLKSADKIILPGVGAFGYIMSMLKKNGLDVEIKKQIIDGKPFLGICLGFQVLFEESEEDAGVSGLAIFKGSVIKFRSGKVPHVGWNKVMLSRNSVLSEGFAYFVHSYYPVPIDKDLILYQTDYGDIFCSGVIKNNVIGVQFHPERSGQWGIDFYKKWLSMYKMEDKNG